MRTMTTQEIVEYVQDHPEGGPLYFEPAFKVEWEPDSAGDFGIWTRWYGPDEEEEDWVEDYYRSLEDFADFYDYRDEYDPWILIEEWDV